MIGSLKALFGKAEEVDEKELEHRLHLAAGALLVEMSRADYVVDPVEQRTRRLNSPTKKLPSWSSYRPAPQTKPPRCMNSPG